MGSHVAVGVLLGVVSASAQAEPGTASAPRLRRIDVLTQDVFGRGLADERFVPWLVNATHWTTREAVVRRQIWLLPGQRVSDEDAAQLERNLRRLGLFSEVVVTRVPIAGEDGVDLSVVTRDRFSLVVGALAGYVGGVGGLQVSAGENNFLGLGDRIAFDFFETTEDEYRGRLSYRDLHLFDTLVAGRARLGRSDEGDSVELSLSRPFVHLEDPHSWNGGVAYEESEVDYFSGGDAVIEVPVRRYGAIGGWDHAWGSEQDRRTIGPYVGWSRRAYGVAAGPLAATVRVPGTTFSGSLGLRGRREWRTGFREVTGLDTIDFVQDVTLGFQVGASLGLGWRHESSAGSAAQPEAGANARWSLELAEGLLANQSVAATARWDLDRGQEVGWTLSMGSQWFYAPWSGSTLALSGTLDAARELQDLPAALTLGEDNGLRGYRAREFSGERRLRVSLEDRIDTGLELATVHLGLVGFLDCGWVGGRDGWGRPYPGAGAGLRLGSKELFGSAVLRVDVAWPLEDVLGADDGPQVSIAVGQAFTFGGVQSVLATR